MGRGSRRGESSIKTRLLSPALSSIRWRRGGQIVESLLPPMVLAGLTEHARFTRRRQNPESLPHKSFAKEEARWPSMGSAASPRISFTPCWIKPFHATPVRRSISDWPTLACICSCSSTASRDWNRACISCCERNGICPPCSKSATAISSGVQWMKRFPCICSRPEIFRAPQHR